jgi:hypothetical protein
MEASFGARAKGFARRVANSRLYDQKVIDQLTADIVGDEDFMAIFRQCEEYTMTSLERGYALYSAIRQIHANKIEGDVVETGVWRGGSSMISALTLKSLGDTSRDLWLYDTYEGMTEPTETDVSWDGRSAQEQYEEIPGWCAASLDDVRTNMGRTGYPAERIHYIEGKVEDTIPSAGVPESIALLRLDTDWYVSNKHELNNLYPRLVSGGVLLIDDYGHWEGVRKSVDEYLAEHSITAMLHRVDYTARLLIKP